MGYDLDFMMTLINQNVLVRYYLSTKVSCMKRTKDRDACIGATIGTVEVKSVAIIPIDIIP